MIILWSIMSVLVIVMAIVIVLIGIGHCKMISGLMKIIKYGDDETKRECIHLYENDYGKFIDMCYEIEG